MPNKRDIGIVVVNWRSKEVIWECLESIGKAGYLESVVIVDNASKDGSLEKLKAQSAKRKFKILENSENLGFAQGNNKGIEYLLGDSFTPGESWLAQPREPATIRGGNLPPNFILILNPDTEINEDTIPNLLKVMEKDEKIGIVGPKIYSDSSTSVREHPRGVPQAQHHPWGGGVAGVSKPRIWSCGGEIDKKRYSGGLIGLGEVDRRQYDKLKEVDFISGTAMMVKREVFERCGLFNSDYFIYYEDVELSQKAKKADFKLLVVPSSVIYHKESTSMKKASPAHEYYMARNHLLFVERNAPFFVKLREIVRLPKTIYEHWQKEEKWAIRGIGDYFMRHFGKLRSPSGESWLA